jgi:hypothetical protein
VSTVDWERIRAEYIAGGASIRNLADKYGISKDAVGRRAKAEKWKETRDKTATKVRQRTNERIVAQKADEAANNAVIAARIRSKLLLRLESEIDTLPGSIGTESAEDIVKSGKGGGRREVTSKRWRLRDLTAAYKDLTADMDLADVDTEDIDATREEVYGDEDT